MTPLPLCRRARADNLLAMFHDIVQFWFHLLEDWGYLGVFLLMAAESSIVPVPSEVVMPPAAYWATQGRMDFWLVVLAGTAGSWFGSAISYWGALWIGRPLLVRFGFKRVLLGTTFIGAGSIAACAAFTPRTPAVVILLVLLTGGFFRSLQFTSVNVLAYAEVERERLSHATSFAGTAQQQHDDHGGQHSDSHEKPSNEVIHPVRVAEVGSLGRRWRNLVMPVSPTFAHPR